MSRVIVAGPPCSGKSSYIRERAQAGDVIVDYDQLHQVISGLPLYHHDDQVKEYAMAVRDCLIDRLAIYTKQPAWVTTGSPKAAKLELLKSELGAELVILRITREEAHRRCNADKRPSEWHGFIDRWFDETDIDMDGDVAKQLSNWSAGDLRLLLDVMMKGGK